MRLAAWKWIVISGFLLTLAGGYLMWRNLQQGPLPPGEVKTVTEFRDGNPLPSFQLNGSHGAFSQANFLRQWSFVFFGYIQCPDVCPTALSTMKAMKAELSAVSPAPTFQVVFVSVDPTRDTLPLLGEFMAAFDPAFIGITGNDAALQPLIKDFGVYYQRNDANDKKHYTVDHTATIYLIDPQGRLAAVFSPPQMASAMATDFRRISARR